MFDNDSDRSESPKDFQSFIQRLKKRKSSSVDHPPAEKLVKLNGQHDQNNLKNLPNKKHKSKQQFEEHPKVYQSKITTHYRTVKGSLFKQNPTKKKRNWDNNGLLVYNHLNLPYRVIAISNSPCPNFTCNFI
nr:unnamed protein product [Callosobruchus chinensis]